IENPRITRSDFSWVKGSTWSGQNIDMRDDRALVYTSLKKLEKQEFYILMRATTRGAFLRPPLGAEAMYKPEIHSYQSGDTVLVFQQDAQLNDDERLAPLPQKDSIPAPPVAGPNTKTPLWKRLLNRS
ncbi:MAG: hypothetical protein AAF570_23100, partial [Bacteroidota bacterium]